MDRIYPRETFEKEAANIMNAEAGLTKADLDILLTYLARDKKEVAFDSQVSRSYSSLLVSRLMITRPSSSEDPRRAHQS